MSPRTILRGCVRRSCSDPRCIPEALDRWPRSMSLLTMTSQAVYYVSELPPRTILAKRKISHNHLHKESEERAHHQKTPQSMGRIAQPTSPQQYTYGYPVHMSKAAGAPNKLTHANGITQMPPRMRRQTKTSIGRAPPDWVQATKGLDK